MYRLKHAFVEGQNIMGLMLMPFTIFIEIKRYDMMNAFVYLIEFTAKFILQIGIRRLCKRFCVAKKMQKNAIVTV